MKTVRKVKGLLFILSSAAALLAVSGAQAADLPLKAKAVEYVKICSLYGAGFYYIPGSDTCLKVGGYLRTDVLFHTNTDYQAPVSGAAGAENRFTNNYMSRARANINFDTRTATEYGVLRTYAETVATWTSTSDTVAGGTFAIYHAFIQFAGFTMGRTYSIMDAPWQSYPAGGADLQVGGPNHVTGVNQFAYTAEFGGGVSGSLALQDPAAQDQTNIWNTSSATAAGMIGGAYGTNSLGGESIPDVIGRVRIDQAWGLFQLAGVAHNNHVSYYNVTNETTGHPDDKWGFAVSAALSIKNIPTGVGDSVNLQATYADGASRYVFHALMPTTYAMYGGSSIGYQSLGIGSVADAVFSGTSSANGTQLELVKTWGVRGGFNHNWNPTWSSGFYAAYGQVNYGAAGKAAICANATTLLGLTGACNPNFSESIVGFNVVWTPVKGFAFTTDVNYTYLGQQYSGTITAPAATAIAKPAGVYEMKSQGAPSMMLRVQRNW